MDDLTNNVRAIVPLIDETIDLQQRLSSLALELVHPPEGPYALFHHVSYLIERLRGVRIILIRLGQERREVSGLFQQENQMPRRPSPGRPFPQELVPIYQRRDEVTSQMRVDFESLYIFANLALDQWAHVIAYLTGGPSPEEANFQRLTSELRSLRCRAQLLPLRERHLRDVIWLYYQIRAYRNIFIEHIRRPWQRGSTMSVVGEDFGLFIPTPPYWLQATVVQEALAEIVRLAPRWFQDPPSDYWETENPHRVLEITFQHIDEIDRQSDQEKIWAAWELVGGSTVSFDRIADRFARFMLGSTKTLLEMVAADPSSINVGPPLSEIPEAPVPES